MEKTCTSCKKLLDSSLFIIDFKEYKRCNKCRDYSKIYYKNERIKFPEKSRNRQKKYKINNLEKVRARDNIAQKKYRKENLEKYRVVRKLYQDKNKAKINEYDKNRMLNRPEYFLFSSARSRSRKYKTDFTITENDIKELLDRTLICPLRQIKFDRGKNQKASPNSASIDRINSLKGYTKDNIWIISYRANLIKNSCDLQTFEKIIKNLEYPFHEEHCTDSTAMATILQDRLNQFEEEKWPEKDKYRLLNIEKWLINSAKKRSKKYQLEFNIDVDYIKSIWPLDNKCPILEEKFVSGKKIISKNSATIDRINNDKGYIKGNVMIISALANSVKNDADIKELKLILENWMKASIK